MKMTFVELTFMGWKDKEKKELFLERLINILMEAKGEGGDYELKKDY